MDAPRSSLAVVVARAPEALIELCGISLVERLLRNLQREGLREAIIISDTEAAIRQHLATPSWARSGLAVVVKSQLDHADVSAHDHFLLLRGDACLEARLIGLLANRKEPTLLIDSDPPATLEPFFNRSLSAQREVPCGAALITLQQLPGDPAGTESLGQLMQLTLEGNIDLLDVTDQPTYVVTLRRHLRPLWFPAPGAEHRSSAERLLLDAAQNGTLDFPARLHAPIETWIVARLCRTSITPNQITFFTAFVSAGVTLLFAAGHLWAGVAVALAVGILDGLDGKQARVKVETTELGKREHIADYVLELSWWCALAFHFAGSSFGSHAYVLLVLLVASDLFDRWAKRAVKQRTGRNLDDVAPFDRAVRFVGGRRNIYVWMFAAGLLAGIPDKAFLALCGWGALTAALHVGRAFQLCGASWFTKRLSH